MKTIPELQEELSVLLDMKMTYEAGTIALTQPEVREMYHRINSIPKEIQSVCPHTETKEVEEPWTDVGYGPDIHYVEYVKRCVSCNADLGKTRPGRRLW